MSYLPKVLNALKSVISEHNQHKFGFVYIGVVNWATFDFGSHPHAASIFMADYNESLSLPGASQVTVSIDLFTKSPSHVNDGELDVDNMATLIEDAEAILTELRTRKDGPDAIVLKTTLLGIIGAAMPAADSMPQGIIVNVELAF